MKKEKNIAVLLAPPPQSTLYSISEARLQWKGRSNNMATWPDQQIEQLEDIVEKQFDLSQRTCTARGCVLARSHENTEPHLSLVEFLEMQIRWDAKIFAAQAPNSAQPKTHQLTAL